RTGATRPPYTTLFRSAGHVRAGARLQAVDAIGRHGQEAEERAVGRDTHGDAVDGEDRAAGAGRAEDERRVADRDGGALRRVDQRSEEHTSELQSRENL